MPRVLCLLVVALCALWSPTRAPAENLLFAPFDAAPFDATETRLMHVSLAALGDYDGPLDGAWHTDSSRAFNAYVLREFDGAPLNFHAAALIVSFLAEIDRIGWTYRNFSELGVSMALPELALTPPEAEADGKRWWSRKGSLTLLTHRFGPEEAGAWHDAARAANADPASLGSSRNDRTMITEGRLSDGRTFFTRSDRMPEHWATVFIAGGADEAQLLTLMRSSLRPGPPEEWQLREDGRLDRLVRATLALVERLDVAEAFQPPQALRLTDDRELTASGTAFFVSERVLVTARHVIGDCASIGLADGTQLTLIAEDRDLDVAALAAPGPSLAWLPLLPAKPARLGQRVHAMGFPYYSIAGTSLHLTGGNVSALRGVNDDRRFFSFTAPVQPGSSGGPLIGTRGAVLGVVVSRLSDSYIAETTGTLPQNVNYALSNSELVRFLARSGVAPAASAPGDFDLDADGVPMAVEAAVVPVLCL